MQKELHGFVDALGTSLWKTNAITAVVFGGSANTPALKSMRRPGATSGGWFKDEHFGARRRAWRFVKIKSTVELGLGREARVDARGTEQV